MGRDGRDINWTSDESGKNWLVGEDGKFVYVNGEKMPGPANKIPDPISGFTTYDSSQGHCGLCGRLTCSGGCFK